MSQLRLNPLNGKWVTIVAERGGRPTDFAPRARDVELGPRRDCPFCPGHHDAEPEPVLERLSADGNWQVLVFPNKYPAFSGTERMSVRNLGPVHVQAAASGLHEVLVFTPRHDSTWATLDDDEITIIMAALRDRFVAHCELPHVRYTQAIVNQGREAGASLAHPHGQLLGTPFVPGEILDEERAFARFEGGCVLCTTIAAEESDESRVVYSDDHVMVVCPFWSGVPYEMLVMPRSHAGHIPDSSDEELFGVGRGIRNVLNNLNGLLGDVAYNLVFHTSPHQHRDGHFHWHAHIFPKLSTVAGFERGTGVMINITPPEAAAEQMNHIATQRIGATAS